MDFDTYQRLAAATALYPDVGNNVLYPTLGLCGESGEVAEKVKKVLRDHGGTWSTASREAVKLELGDVLWYVSRLAAELDLSLDDVATTNLGKLKSRQQRHKICGEGDLR